MSNPCPASSVILRRGERLLLVRRVHPPSAGLFAFPGGRGETGETPQETALRELYEETGLRAQNPRLFATYTLSGHEGGPGFFLSVFTAQADENAQAVPGDDAVDPGWYSLDEIRRLPVPQSVLDCAERLMRDFPEQELHGGENRAYLS